MTPRWRVEQVRGAAADLHAGSAELLQSPEPARTARILVAEAPAVVLGSHEPEDWFDPDALHRAGLGLARRRSGGGAVLVGAGRTVWVDFVVPAGDPLWDEDVGRAAWWVGEWWVDVLVAAGAAARSDLAVWRAGMRPSRWSPLVCFAGVGPGEVELQGRKVIGVSQRRTRRAALFQSAVLLDWDPGLWLSLLSDAGRRAVAGYRPDGTAPADLVEAARALDAGREVDVVASIRRALMT